MADLTQRALDRVPQFQDALLEGARSDSRDRYLRWIEAYDTIGEADLAAIAEVQSHLGSPTPLSLVVPLTQATEQQLRSLEQSLSADVHERWALSYVVDTSVSLDGEITALLERAAERDSRFAVSTGRSGSLAGALNEALRSGPGEFVVLLEPDVMVRPHTLFLVAETIREHPEALLIYGDEDRIDADGVRFGHHFKPDWNEALLGSQNYLGGLVAVRRSHALEVGGFQDEQDGDVAWGLFLRMGAGAPPGAVRHLPFVLSHRRVDERSHAPTAVERDRIARAHEIRLERIGRRARVVPVGESSYRADDEPPYARPTVSVVIPSTGKLGLLQPCLEGVLHRTSYPALEVVLVVGEDVERMSDESVHLGTVATRPRVHVLIDDDRPFSFSRVNNRAARKARGELLCFLNDDTEVIREDWLSQMVARALQERVAAVGALLLYPNDRIQHAGVVLGVGGLAAHNLKGWRRGTVGYHDRGCVDQEVSCVTAACMLVRRDVFLDLGGFNERLAVDFNDVDLCLRLVDAGWRVVWTPSAELYHKERASIGAHDAGDRDEAWKAEWNVAQERWSTALTSDPHYSPNLSLDSFQLWEPSFPPRVSYPWRVEAAHEARPAR